MMAEGTKDITNERMSNMIKAGIIGATGYAGGELVRILTGHRDVEIKWYGSRSYIDQRYCDVYRNMFRIVEDVCRDDNLAQLAEEVDVIFTATPQGFLAGLLTEEILQKVKVVDLSADYRIKDVAVYEKWYKIEHKSPQFIQEAVYGLCEINRGQITEQTRLVANPGCYTTCSILTAYPLVKEGLIDTDSLIVDAKSGTSGAGRGAKVSNLYCEVNENIKAYGVAGHRHTPEIEEQLGYAAGRPLVINFTPHLVPMNRGILVTEYARLIPGADGSLPSYEEIKAIRDTFMIYPSREVPTEIKQLAQSKGVIVTLAENIDKHLSGFNVLVKESKYMTYKINDIPYGLSENATKKLLKSLPTKIEIAQKEKILMDTLRSETLKVKQKKSAVNSYKAPYATHEFKKFMNRFTIYNCTNQQLTLFCVNLCKRVGINNLSNELPIEYKFCVGSGKRKQTMKRINNRKKGNKKAAKKRKGR